MRHRCSRDRQPNRVGNVQTVRFWQLERARSVACSLALAALCACNDDSPELPDPAPSGCAALDFEAFDQAVESSLSAKRLRGASVVVVHEDCGVVHTQGYGEFSAERLYLVGSASKIISVGVLMRLGDAGMLDIDAPIGDYLSAWGENGKPELTVAQLVSNSSGLVGLIDNPIYPPYRCQYGATGTLSGCARTIYTASDSDKRVAPDTAFRYGGGQWQLAGGVAESVSGKSWAELVRETYVESCDARSFGFTNQFSIGGLGSALDYPVSFQGDVANLPSTANPSVEGGLFTNVADYGKVLLMHLRGGQCSLGKVLSEGAVSRMREDRILEVYGGSTAGSTGRANGAGAFEGYGLGWWIDRAHAGVFADPGLYGAFPWLDLQRGYGAFVAIEGDSGETGAALYAALKPLLDAEFDAAFQKER